MSITTAGSTTVQPVLEKLAEAYLGDNTDVEINVGSGGSSVGVKSAHEGTVDIGHASRELKSDELEYGLVTHLLARDGIAIITHPDNTVTGLTTTQVKDIFAGTVTSWSEVGGTASDINVMAREAGSGTRGAFEELVMDGEEIASNALLHNSNGTLRTAVSGDPNSIGFLSFGYLDDSVKALSVDGVEGTVENAKDGTYPIVRPLYLLTKDEPEGEVKWFIDFCLSAEGQAIVEAEGYISVS